MLLAGAPIGSASLGCFVAGIGSQHTAVYCCKLRSCTTGFVHLGYGIEKRSEVQKVRHCEAHRTRTSQGTILL